MMADLTTYLVDDVLTKVDRASMAISLEVRVPLLDHRVVEYALSLPLGSRRRKQSLKALLGRYLPNELFERPKTGFSIPLDEWLRGELRSLLDTYLGEERLRREGLFHASVVRALVREFLGGNKRLQRPLWALMAFEMWREHAG